MTDQNSQNKLVEKLISYSSFSQSSIYPNLLKYLAECSKRGYTPKESEIAENVFGKKDFDSSADPLIRVHVSKLRKKLDEYFQQEGKGEELKIVIPARHYNIEFKQNKQILPKPEKKSVNYILLVIIVLLIFLQLYFFVTNKNLIKQITTSKLLANDELIWSDFLHSKLPTIYTVGNIYTYCEYVDEYKNYLIINNPLVNDRKSLEDYIIETGIPKQYIWEPIYEVLPKSALLNYSRLEWLFQISKKNINTKLSTKMEWEDFRRNNILYLGHFHNLGMLKEFYNMQHIYSPHSELDYQKRKTFLNTDSLDILIDNIKNDQSPPVLISSHLEVNLQKINLTYPDMDTTLSLTALEQSNYIKDYVAVSKLPGPNKNTLLFIISMHQIGRMEVVKMLTDLESYEAVKAQIEDKTESLPKYFEMIFEVEGFKETAMKIELLHFYPLEEEFEVQ